MKTIMKTINSKTRIELRWSTEPALVGYADNTEQASKARERFLVSKPDFVGTPRQVCEYWRRVRQGLGGVYTACNLRTRVTQQEICWDDVNLTLFTVPKGY